MTTATQPTESTTEYEVVPYFTDDTTPDQARQEMRKLARKINTDVTAFATMVVEAYTRKFHEAEKLSWAKYYESVFDDSTDGKTWTPETRKYLVKVMRSAAHMTNQEMADAFGVTTRTIERANAANGDGSEARKAAGAENAKAGNGTPPASDASDFKAVLSDMQKVFRDLSNSKTSAAISAAGVAHKLTSVSRSGEVFRAWLASLVTGDGDTSALADMVTSALTPQQCQELSARIAPPAKVPAQATRATSTRKAGQQRQLTSVK